jgi:hypothetical protein
MSIGAIPPVSPMEPEHTPPDVHDRRTSGRDRRPRRPWRHPTRPKEEATDTATEADTHIDKMV